MQIRILGGPSACFGFKFADVGCKAGTIGFPTAVAAEFLV